MAILSGGLTVRRFRVDGDLRPGWRERLKDQLVAMTFADPPAGERGEENEGWVQIDDLLMTSFDDPNRWLVQDWVVFALRYDKKTLPANLLKATVAQRCRAWCEEKNVERVPASTKKEIKEQLEDEWFRTQLPRVSVVEIAWNVEEGVVLVGSTSERMLDRVRTRFHRTFGLELHPWSPLDALPAVIAEDLLATSPMAGGVA